MSTDRAPRERPHVVISAGPPPGCGPAPDPGGVVPSHARQAAEQLVTMGLLAFSDLGEASAILAGYGQEMWQDGWTEARGVHRIRDVWLLPDEAAARRFVVFAAEQGIPGQAHPAADPLDRLLDHAEHCAGREVR